MTVITEAELREMWQGGRGVIPPLPDDTRFTPSARDFINQWRLEVSYLSQATVQTDSLNTDKPGAELRPAWDKPGEFPVNLSGPLPVCSVCGQPVAKKPGHMSQLDAGHFAPKTTPRFVFRGKMDTLHAQFLLALNQARRFNLPQLADYLATLAAYCREIMSAEYNQRPVSPLQLAGLSEAEIHERTHWPERALAINHLVPGPDDHEMILHLNLLRCQVRELELVAAQIFSGPDGQPTRLDLIQAINRLSSAVYYLALLLKAGKISWQMFGWMEKKG